MKKTYNFSIEELKKTNFFPSQTQINRSLEDSVEFPLISGNNPFGKFINAEKFEDDNLISSIFKENTEKYCKSLLATGFNGIRVYPLSADAINTMEKPFVVQIVYGKDDATANICIKPTILFVNSLFYIFGIKEDK